MHIATNLLFKLRALVFITLFIPVLVGKAHGQTWQSVGSVGFSDSIAGYTSIAIDSSGVPYVVYEDYANYKMAAIRKFNGSSWVTVGGSTSAGEVDYASIAIDSGGTPYIVYADCGGPSCGATVIQYADSGWVPLGSTGFSVDAAQYTSIAIDGNSTTYVVFSSEDNDWRATVMKCPATGGGNWEPVGSSLGFSIGLAEYCSIAIDPNGIPYVAYQDIGSYNVGISVMRFVGGGWQYVGSPGFSANATYTAISIDSGGTPYVVFSDPNTGGLATVMKYNDTGWAIVGNAGFSSGIVQYTSIAIDKWGTPYVAYEDGGNGDKATVMKFVDSNWVTVGNAGFSADTAVNTMIAISRAGVPYIVYSDGGNDYKVTVMTLGAQLGPVTGTDTVCVNATTILSDTSSGGTWSSSDTGIATVASGIVTGIAAGTARISYTVAGNSATVVVTVNSCAPVLRHEDMMTVFPDPSNGTFILNISSIINENANVIITNIMGAKVKVFTLPTNTNKELEITDGRGMYFVSAFLESGAQVQRVKLMVQ